MDFRLSFNSGNGFIDLFPVTNLQAIQNNNYFLYYSTLDVTIPAPTNQDVSQIININITESQASAPFDVFLKSEGNQALSDYNTISQIQITSNQLIITRLYNWPQNSIDIRIVFKEVGV